MALQPPFFDGDEMSYRIFSLLVRRLLLCPGGYMSDQIISPDLRGAAARRTRWRMLGKFVGILAALLAYTFLRGIEGAKHSYDEEHGRPIVLVGDQYAVENAARAANDTAKDAAFALGSSGCLPLYPEKGTQTPVQTPTPVQKKRPDAILLRVCALQGFFDKSEVHSSALKNTLEKKLMYQNFTDAKGIVDRLDDEI